MLCGLCLGVTARRFRDLGQRPRLGPPLFPAAVLRLALFAVLACLSAPAAGAQVAPPSERGRADDAARADVDERTNVAIRLASDAQALYLRPVEYGGGGGSFDGVSLASLEYPTDKAGRYVRPSAAGATHAYTLVEADGVVTITAASDASGAVVRVTVTGPRPEHIAVTA